MDETDPLRVTQYLMVTKLEVQDLHLFHLFTTHHNTNPTVKPFVVHDYVQHSNDKPFEYNASKDREMTRGLLITYAPRRRGG